jgi:hypothetical protein
MVKNTKCPFCQQDAHYQSVTNVANLYSFDCPTVCSTYSIEISAYEKLTNPGDLRNLKLNCIRENIILEEQGLIPFWSIQRKDENFHLKGLPENISFKCFDDYECAPIPHAHKSTEILLLMAISLKDHPPFSEIKLVRKNYLKLRIEDRVELFEWMKVLRKQGWVLSSEAKEMDNNRSMEGNDGIKSKDLAYSLTPAGWEQVEKISASIMSKNAFIAMRFSGNTDRAQMQTAIENACKDTGWTATTIDKEEFLGGISDEIIAKINQSNFIVAEFTGQNHGVYYEAGYAAGRNIPVIYAVRDSDSKNLHFDTKHINHIVWISFDDLYTKVKNRIEATINIQR